jgi:sister-chromatid-cohesion protein PDS5
MSVGRATRQTKGGGGGPEVSSSTDAILYPQGCKDVSEEMHADELIRRLKVLASAFQSMGQEENAYDEYVPVCLHLAEDGFLNHQSKDVRLLIACCIADILRIYAPEAPYKDSEQVKVRMNTNKKPRVEEQ